VLAVVLQKYILEMYDNDDGVENFFFAGLSL
jgi:hypothetical protein